MLKNKIKYVLMDLRYKSKRSEVFFYFVYRFIGFFLNLKTRLMSPKALQPQSTLCVLPWMHFYSNEIGNNFPCCISTDTSLPNVNSLGQKYSIYEPGQIEKAWNSGYMKDIRKKMMNGEQPSPCEKCYKMENLGAVSHRQHSNKKWQGVLSKSLNATAPDGTAPIKIYSADIRLGNLCNLKCRMCSPVSSKGLINEWKSINGMPEFEAKKFAALDWFEKPEFWEIFLKYSDDLQSLHFAGGEPFIIEQHFTFLRKLVEANKARNISLTYNTNLTVLPQELLTLWQSFKSVHVMVSLDGMEQVNHYVRYPSNWSKIQQNIQYLHDNLEKYHVEYLDFNITVQAYNIYDTMKLVDFIITQYPKAQFPNLSLLFGPEELSVQILPAAMKAELTTLWNSFIEERKGLWFKKARHQSQAQTMIDNAQAIVEFMNKQDRSDLLPHFKMRTKAYDASRRQSCASAVPELASLFPHSQTVSK